MLASENNSGSAEKQARRISPEFAQVSFPTSGVCSTGWRSGASPVAGAGSITGPISTASSGSQSARNSRFPTTPVGTALSARAGAQPFRLGHYCRRGVL